MLFKPRVKLNPGLLEFGLSWSGKLAMLSGICIGVTPYFIKCKNDYFNELNWFENIVVYFTKPLYQLDTFYIDMGSTQGQMAGYGIGTMILLGGIGFYNTGNKIKKKRKAFNKALIKNN